MTQLMLFEEIGSTTNSFYGSAPAVAVTNDSKGQSAKGSSLASSRADASPASLPSCAVSGAQSIPVHQPQRGEIQRLGDLAQLIIARYELVAQRKRILRERQLARG